MPGGGKQPPQRGCLTPLSSPRIPPRTRADRGGQLAAAIGLGQKDLVAAGPPADLAALQEALAGIDADHDGLRDDVQRWIATNYSHSEKTRAALRQKARALQAYIEDGNDPAKARRDAVAIDNASECLEAIRGDFYYINRDFDSVVLNTYPRLKTYLDIDKKYGDTSASGDRAGNWKKSCDFDPDKMKN